MSVTTNLILGDLPGNVRILAPIAGLTEDSVVNITQVVTADRDFLESRMGALPEEYLRRVEDGLRLIQGL